MSTEIVVQQDNIVVQQDNIVSVIDGHATTTSNRIAEVFGKQHRDVTRAIENLLPQLPEDTLRNFARTDFIDKNGVHNW